MLELFSTVIVVTFFSVIALIIGVTLLSKFE